MGEVHRFGGDLRLLDEQADHRVLALRTRRQGFQLDARLREGPAALVQWVCLAAVFAGEPDQLVGGVDPPTRLQETSARHVHGLDRFVEEVDRKSFEPVRLPDLAGLAGR